MRFRAAIPAGFLDQPHLLQRSRSDLESATLGVQDVQGQRNQYQWFYQGKNGWWKFEARCSQELEDCQNEGVQRHETMICGNLYVIDFVSMVQYRKDQPQRKRAIKRDVVLAQCKGVAGLVVKQEV